MPAVHLNCPLCNGLFEVDDAWSGHQVDCPLCSQAVTIPDLAPSGEPAYSTSAAEEGVDLDCPLCSGVFQITREMYGLEVACPHCQGAVLISNDDEPNAPGYYEAPLAGPAGWQPPFYTPPQHFPPPPSTRSRGWVDPNSWEAPIAPPPGPGATAEPPLPSFYPPAVPSSPPQPLPTQPFAPASPPPPPAPPKRPSVDDMLPPGVSPARPSPSAEKRPRGDRGDGPAAPLPTGPSVDSLLPPGAGPSGASNVAASPKIKTEGKKEREKKPQAEAMVIQTAEGETVELREPVRKVAVGGGEKEIVTLSPEEKARRRLIRNFIMVGAGAVILILSAVVLVWLTSG